MKDAGFPSADVGTGERLLASGWRIWHFCVQACPAARISLFSWKAPIPPALLSVLLALFTSHLSYVNIAVWELVSLITSLLLPPPVQSCCTTWWPGGWQFCSASRALRCFITRPFPGEQASESRLQNPGTLWSFECLFINVRDRHPSTGFLVVFFFGSLSSVSYSVHASWVSVGPEDISQTLHALWCISVLWCSSCCEPLQGHDAQEGDTVHRAAAGVKYWSTPVFLLLVSALYLLL